MTPTEARDAAYELRRKQEKLERYATIANWAMSVNQVKTFEVKLSWNYGSACVGYKDVEKIIQQKVEKLMSELIEEAVKEAEIEANANTP